jgi:hypothetical protein
MPRQTFIDGRYASYQAAVPANLVGKEFYAVELVPGTKTIQLFQATSSATPLGVLCERLEGQDTWKVALYGKGGTVRCIAGGAIGQAPAPIRFQAGGQVVANVTSQASPSHGLKVSDLGANVANDIVEVLDVPVTV